MKNKRIYVFLIIFMILVTMGCGQPELGDMPIVNLFLEKADQNHNGTADREEITNIIRFLKSGLFEPHTIKPPFTQIVDENRDGNLEMYELDNLRNVFAFGLLPRLFETNPDLAAKLDRNNNRQIDSFECQAVKELLFAMDSPLRNPRKVVEDWDIAMDLNQDKYVDEKEIDTIINKILFELVRLPFNYERLLEESRSTVPDGIKVENRIQEIMDFNNNGFVENHEIKDMITEFFRINPEPGKIEDQGTIRNPGNFRDRLDINRDGFLTEAELKQMRGILEEAAARMEAQQGGNKRLPVKEAVDKMLDINNDGYIDMAEFNSIREVFDKMEKTPHKTTNNDRKIDLNRDNKITLEEIKTVGNRLKNLSKEFMQTDKGMGNGRVVETVLDELADVNNNRFLDPGEIEIMDNTLSKPDKARTQFAKRIDYNGNGEVESFEIEKALRARDLPIEGMQGKMPEKVRAQTAIDGIFDLNGDGFISNQEVEEAISYFVRGPRKIDPDYKLSRVFDLNKDQFFSQEEMRFILDNFLRPHPVTELEIDKKSDKNRNGFIEPEEIGIAAGHTAAGNFFTFEERIEQQLMRQEGNLRIAQNENDKTDTGDKTTREQVTPAPTPPPLLSDGKDTENGKINTIFQKKIDIRNKKIAVVDLKTGSDIDKDFSDAIIMFAENAFVNIGTAIVVDRQNITKIIKEYEFQANDLADAATAARIGKLAGADVIVIGNLNYVGKKYYLNIKLIDVSTAQILGSSIDTANDDTEFFDMCNNTVSKLF